MKFILLLTALLVPVFSEARTIFVDQDRSTPDADGTNWIKAYSDLQDALAAARSGDRILVAEGIYLPGSEPSDTFNLVSGVAILGGFQGNETATSQRDIQANQTILSGDINGDDPGLSAGVSAAGLFSPANRLDNSVNVLTGENLNASTILDGFTISGGHADGERTGIFGGGAVRLIGSSMILRSCTFENNFANSSGGAIAASGPNVVGSVRFPLVIEKCLFENNEADQNGLGLGAAVAAESFLELVVRGSVFRRNKAKRSAAIFLSRLGDTGRSEILESVFEGNRASQTAGALEIRSSTRPLLRNCSFKGNSVTSRGGAILVGGNAEAQLFNCAFQGNHAEFDAGGAISGIQCELSLINCSFQGNRSRRGGALHFQSSTVTVSNSVFWNNANSMGTDGLGASIDFQDISSTPTMPVYRNNLIQNWDGTSADAQGSSASSGNFDGTTSVSAPLFLSMVDPATAPILGGDLSIPAESFLVNRGVDSLNSAKFDLALNLRKVEAIDLGAYEYQNLDVLWLQDDDGDGVVFGMEQAIGTPPYLFDDGNGKRFTIDETTALNFGVNSDASPRTRWSIVRSTNLDGFPTVVYGPSATPPALPFLDQSPPPNGKAFYRLEIGLAP